MRALIRFLLGVHLWAVAAGVAHAAPILLLQDRYQAATQIVTFEGDRSNVRGSVGDSREGSIWSDVGLNDFMLTSEADDGPDLASASVGLRHSDFGTNSWEAFAMAGGVNIGSLDHDFTGTRFDAYWQFVASDDDTTIRTGLTQESSGTGWMTLMDMTAGQTIFSQGLGGGIFRFSYVTPLQNGHIYSLTTSLLTGAGGDPDVRAHVFSDDGFVPAPVPEPTTMLLFGTGAAALAARRRWIARRKVD